MIEVHPMTSDRSGQRIDTYQLIRQLGSGTFGEVYLGEHIYRKTQVAIKILNMRLSNDAFYDFINEARIFRLQHPNIVSILDFGIERASGTPFLVMNYASNGTLRQRHPRGTQVPLANVVSYVKQVSAALQYAHEENLVHRDIKPENMLLDERNNVLLSDFGIAVVSQSMRMPAQGEAAGTPDYMAPEQLMGKPGRASDQYSLGVVVYEWLCGVCPFQGTFFELFGQHLQATPPALPRSIQMYSPGIEQVVMRALAKKPEDRYPTIQAFATALEEQYNQLLGLYRAQTMFVQTQEYYRKEGDTLYDSQRYTEAVAAYSLALSLSSDNPSVYNNRGLAYRHLRDYKKAIADYDSAITLDSNNAFAYNNRGYAYSLLQDFQQAIADYDRAVAIEPKYSLAYMNRGNAYCALGIFSRAVSDFDRVIELDPQYAPAYYNRGNAHDELRDYQKAVADFDRAIELDPYYVKAYTNRAYVYRNIGKYQQAIADYNCAIELDPGNVNALTGRGITYNLLKQYDQSIADFDRALELDPNAQSAYTNKSGVLRMLIEQKEASQIINPGSS